MEVFTIAKKGKILPDADALQLTKTQKLISIPLSVAFFLTVCFLSASTIKVTAIALLLCALPAALLCFTRLQERTTPVLLVLALFVAMGGISTFYAASGKFALNEFLKLLAGFCLALLLLSVAPEKGHETGRWIAAILEMASALSGLVSIDMLSTRVISGALIALLGSDYQNLSGVEPGVRMTSLFQNPNVFAGCMGLGVLLSLGLSLSSREGTERKVHVCLLYVNALAFLLAFSMGASGFIALAFLVYLFLEQKERRPGTLLLMVETLLLTGASAAVISQTSFQAWDGVQVRPLLCTVLGTAGLCLADTYLGTRAAGKLNGKAAAALTGGIVVLLAGYVLAGWYWTGGVTLQPGGVLRRAAYPDPGNYTMEAGNPPVLVRIESQNQRETMMHTSTLLYNGPVDGASFAVPEDSLVVYFNFTAEADARLESASIHGTGGAYKIPLGYKLFPGFIANRLQGLFANENAIQRLVFFSDGLKLFRKSPVIGRGMGIYESGVKSVQSFYYETKYAHNHYIQVLAETGVIGLFLFLALLVISAVSVCLDWRRGKEAHPLTPALGAAVVFMAGHAAVEVVFSTYPYVPFALVVFGLVNLCCGGALPKLGEQVKNAAILVQCVLMVGFGVLLVLNMEAQRVVHTKGGMSSLVQAAKLDPFEWADYMLTYVAKTMSPEQAGSVAPETIAQADKFAIRLAELDSNSIPIYLSEYYFLTDRSQEGLAMVRKYVSYVSSDPNAWQIAFRMLEVYAEDTEEFRSGVLEIGQILDDWNAENMGTVALDEEARAFLEQIKSR